MTHLYILSVEGKTKIGVSNNANKRITGILNQGGYKKERAEIAIYKHELFDLLEKKAHKVLSEKRLSGEWFDITHRDAINSVNEIIANDQLLKGSQKNILFSDIPTNEICKKIGISTAFASQIKLNIRPLPVKYFQKVSEAFHIPMESLFDYLADYKK